MIPTAAVARRPFRKVLRHPLLGPLLRTLPGDGPLRVGWGLKASGRSAMQAAERGEGRLLLLEDAFVRSLRPGEGTVYGLLADGAGVHYDFAGGSDLLVALDHGSPVGWMCGDDLNDRSPGEVMERFRSLGISKYNWFPGAFRGTLLPDVQGVLVVDQTRGDASIRHGGMVESDFDRMLRAAFDEHEGKPVYLRAHPDHLHRAKHSCFSQQLLRDARLRLLSPDLPPAACFALCPDVYVGTSLMGMEALIHGARVTTFGGPFYAGRGLTTDRLPGLEGRGRTALVDLFSAAYFRYCHYFDPDTQEPCGLWRILDHLELQQDMFRKNAGVTLAVGMDPWKRKYTAPFLRSPSGKVEHRASFEETKGREGHLLVWGRKLEHPEPLARMEDGFLRSRGLGAAFHAPYSCVVDGTGIYFDGGAPSDLENLLERGFSHEEIARGERMISLLRETKLTKYNLAEEPVVIDRAKTRGRKVILIPGQVEADASIHHGSPVLKTNADLLNAVREAEPDAWLIHKVHPDLVSGVRHGKLPGAEACDEVVSHGNILTWLDCCDEVHTMTSTTGFEALVRGVPVTTYGIPFYAGWGLTTDRIAIPRRTRRVTLAELVYAALIAYPRYVNPETGEFTTAENVVRLLASDEVPIDRRAWYLRSILFLKRMWVEQRRKQ